MNTTILIARLDSVYECINVGDTQLAQTKLEQIMVELDKED